MRIMLILVVVTTLLLSGLIFVSAPDSNQSWASAILLFASTGIYWLVIAAFCYENFKRAKESQNHSLKTTIGILALAAIAMCIDNFYSMLLTAAAKGIVLPQSWFTNFFDKPIPWSLSAILYNAIAFIMLYVFQSGVLEQVFEEREQRKKLQEITASLEEKNRTLAIIDSISRTLNQSLDIHTILEKLTQQVGLQFKVDLCLVRMLNTQDELVVEGFYGEKSPDLIKTVQKSDQGLAGWVIIQQRMLQVNNVPNDHRITSDDLILRAGVKSYIGLPLLLPMRSILGCMELYSFVPRDFTADEIEALTIIANEAAISIQNARSLEEAERRRNELEELNKFASDVSSSNNEKEVYNLFLNHMRNRFDLSQVLILKKSPDNDFMEIAASLNPLTKRQAQVPILEEPAQCRAIRTGKDVIVSNVLKDLVCQCDLLVPKEGSYLCQPLSMGGSTHGLVHLISPHVNYWNNDRHRILSSYISAIAPALSNLLLMDRERARATTDQLTQVNNRRSLIESLNKQISIIKRQPSGQKTPLSVLMLDLDHFKKFNDNYGHEIGDMVLQNFGKVLISSVRESDFIARYGGEEFCIVLMGADLPASKQIAEKIRFMTEKIDTSFIPDKAPRKITVSIGIALHPEHGMNTQDLLKRADLALYEAKSAGRNRICVASLPSDSLTLFSNTEPRKDSVQ